MIKYMCISSDQNKMLQGEWLLLKEGKLKGFHHFHLVNILVNNAEWLIHVYVSEHVLYDGKFCWLKKYIDYNLYLQAELKQKVDLYKKEREEEEKFLEEQKKAWEEEERERQRQISGREIHRFRDRVSSFIEQSRLLTPTPVAIMHISCLFLFMLFFVPLKNF